MSTRADLMVRDASGRPVMIVEVKARPREPSDLSQDVLEASGKLSFAMLVDPENIRIYAGGFRNGMRAKLTTAQILSAYDPDFRSKKIFGEYLTVLTTAWLRDLAYHWKNTNPPGADELERAGLLRALEGGTTEAEAPT